MSQNPFALSPDLCYVNHAAVAPWPVRTCEAVSRFAAENAVQGAKHYENWLKTENALRAKLARLVNAASTDDVALLKNTSEGLSIIAYGIRWHRGDKVVVPAQEFPSNRIVWESLARFGVTTELVDLAATADPEQALIDACDRRTRLLSVSTVQYANGFRLHTPLLGDFCRRHEILFCVDAIQSLGALAFDAQQSKADFVVADGHKWMLGPEGLALFYSHPAAREQLHLTQYGWHMLADAGNFDNPDWTVATGARCFECGSPNMLGITALNASLAVIEEQQIEKIEQRVLQLTTYLIDKILQTDQLVLLTDTDPERRSGIVSVKHRRLDNQSLFQILSKNNVVCAVRGGGIRISPHFYNTCAQLDYILDLILH